MQVTLNIKADQLQDTVVDLFKNLTSNQKETIATQLVSTWFTEGNLTETLVNRDKIFADLRTGVYDVMDSNNYRNVKYSELRENDYTFTEKVKELTTAFKNTRALCTESIRSALLPLIADDIKKWLASSKEVEEMKDLVIDYFKEQYAASAKKALIDHMAHTITQVSSSQMYALEMKLRQELQR